MLTRYKFSGKTGKVPGREIPLRPLNTETLHQFRNLVNPKW